MHGKFMRTRLYCAAMALVTLATPGCSKSDPLGTNTPPNAPPAAAPGPAAVDKPLADVKSPAALNLATEAAPQDRQPEVAEKVKGPLYLLAEEKGIWPVPFVVSVSNDPFARPQFGVAKAPAVIEALSEGEVTRWWTFINAPTARIGPIRSARIYAAHIAHRYGAPIAHAGANTDALAWLAGYDKDFDEIYNTGDAFFRTADKRPPHNLYTTTDLLQRTSEQRNLPLKAVPATARTDWPLPTSGFITQVDITWHTLNKTAWTWENGAYRRYTDGKPHEVADADGLFAANLVFLAVQGNYRGAEDGWTLDLDKGGKATVISGGVQWEGTWEFGQGGFRLNPREPVLPLRPGKVWVHLLTSWSSFTVK